MNNRTRTGLLALGFDTDLITRIEGHGHTLTALRNLSRNALVLQYDETDVTIILDRLVRKPIDEEIVEKVIDDSDGACCFCADGNQSRPYQIHHAVEYSKTQDNSPDNLILICPNHHQTVPKIMTAEQQKSVRRSWHAIVTMAKAYRMRGLSFPYGSFVSIDFEVPPQPQELIQGYRLSPSTALDVSRHPLASESSLKIDDQKSLIVGGGSGSGKTTLAIGIAGHFWERNFKVFTYRPIKGTSASHAATVLTFMGASDRPSILLIDDANLYFSEVDLSEIMAAANPNAYAVATWAYDQRSNAERFERHFPDWLYVTWDLLRSSTRAYLLAHDAEITAAIRERQDTSDLRRIGLSAMDIPLEHFVRRYESTARSAAEFFFLLRGGQDVVAQEMRLLAEDGRADIPVVYAAIEQIAGFEKTVSVSEVVAACNAVAPADGAPLATESWVEAVFRRQLQRGKMQEVRGEFKPIHRDWAMRLIDAALADKQASVQVKQFLERDLNVASSQLSRLIRLWTWFWHEKNAGPYMRHWLADRTDEEWVNLISHAAADSLENLAIVAERSHLLFRHPQWDLTLASAFLASEQKICSLVDNAEGKDWWALSRLSMAIGHVSPQLAGRIWRQWPPESVAHVIHETTPDQYDWVRWTLGGAHKCAPEWVDQIGKFIRWEEMAPQLRKVAPGDLESIFHCKDILNRARAPVLRSAIRDMAKAMGECLSAAHLSDLHIGFPPIIDITWSVYAEDIKKTLTKVDASRLAAEMSGSTPRDWRKLADLGMWDIPPIRDLVTRIVDQIDVDALAERVASQSEGCEHELRLLLLLMSHASAQKRKVFAERIYVNVKEAVSRNETERLPIAAAFLRIDASLGERLAAEMGVDQRVLEAAVRPADEYRDSVSEWENEAKKLRELIAEMEASGEDYVIDTLIEQIR